MAYFNVRMKFRGKELYQKIQANSVEHAKTIIKQTFPQYRLISVEKDDISLFIRARALFKKKISANEKIATIKQIAVMTDAGISIYDALVEVGDNVTHPELKSIYKNMANNINSGKGITQSIEPYSSVFGNIAIAMTRLGEKTGNISKSYNQLVKIMENIRDSIKKFKKALAMPIVTLVALIIGFVVLIVTVVPQFKAIFEKFNSKLPIATEILLWLENVFVNYGFYIVMGVVLVVCVHIKSYRTNKDYRYKIDRLLVHPRFYLLNKIILYSTMHRYMMVFSELVKSGIPISEALDTSITMVDNNYIKEKLAFVNTNIGRGASLSESLQQTGLVENMLLQMMRAGENSGQLDIMLEKVTDYYAVKLEDIIDNISTYIEPVMLVFVFGLVLLMALGIFMPMWDLGKAIKG